MTVTANSKPYTMAEALDEIGWAEMQLKGYRDLFQRIQANEALRQHPNYAAMHLTIVAMGRKLAEEIEADIWAVLDGTYPR
jgi:hypothetical protein